MLAPILAFDDEPTGGTSAGVGGVAPHDGGISNPPDAQPPDSGDDRDEDSGLDPNVVFDWPETLPGQSGCSANYYVGSFACVIEGSPVTVVGELTFDLIVSMGESTLTISNGRLSDLTPTDTLFGADLFGSLDCVSFQLSAHTENPVAAFGGTFTVELAGEFDPQSLEIIGQLTMTNDAQEVCRGAFQASPAPAPEVIP